MDRFTLILLVVVALVLLVFLGPRNIAVFGGSSTDRGTVPTESVSASTVPAPQQPNSDGYEYVVTEEQYAVRQTAGEFETQRRRRESWRATDGWAWARQTGDDPGQFIFSPEANWRRVRDARPDAADLKQVMRNTFPGLSAKEFGSAEFRFVYDLLGAETLPAQALPTNYRKALIDALAVNDETSVIQDVPDPLGRNSRQVSFTETQDVTNLTQSLHLDQDYRFLAYITNDRISGERGSRVVVERHRASRIPEELLVAVGSERVENTIWG